MRDEFPEVRQRNIYKDLTGLSDWSGGAGGGGRVKKEKGMITVFITQDLTSWVNGLKRKRYD